MKNGKSDSVSKLRERAASLMREARFLEAIKLLNRKSSNTGNDGELSFVLGLCYYKLGRFDEAQEHLIRANDLAPDSATCKWALGAVYIKKKQFKKAEILLAEALQKEEDFYPARMTLSLAYLSQGKIAEAEKTHLDGIKLRPERWEGYKGYAAFLGDVGRDHEAARMKQKAKELNGVN